MTEETPRYITDASQMMSWSEPKQIVTEISGFVPVFDCVLSYYNNIIIASIHGAMWRFCQMEDNVCKASLATIGAMIGVDKATVSRHAKQLCNDGYFKDLTPELKNRPHVYADTGKVKIRSRFDVAQNNAGVAQNNTGVAQNNAGVAQSRLNKVFNKDINKVVDETENNHEGRIFKLYEQNIGLIHNLSLSQELGEYADLPVEWLEYAFKQAADANVRNWRYVRKILESCKASNGIPQRKEKQAQTGADMFPTL